MGSLGLNPATAGEGANPHRNSLIRHVADEYDGRKVIGKDGE